MSVGIEKISKTFFKKSVKILFNNFSDVKQYDMCYGYIQWIQLLEAKDNKRSAVTVVKIKNENWPHYTSFEQHRDLLLAAYLFNLEVELLSNSCNQPDDRTFEAFRVHRQSKS